MTRAHVPSFAPRAGDFTLEQIIHQTAAGLLPTSTRSPTAGRIIGADSKQSSVTLVEHRDVTTHADLSEAWLPTGTTHPVRQCVLEHTASQYSLHCMARADGAAQIRLSSVSESEALLCHLVARQQRAQSTCAPISPQTP